MAAMRCPVCAAAVPAGYQFCDKCGNSLQVRCPRCGAPARADGTFCGQCGAALQPAAVHPAGDAPLVERRRVSILFADLVGFTPMSESRDPEDVRDLLSRYFDLARMVVARYGGSIEKFIGDAVMAVWGTPVVHEDDAERAVRTALDLVEAVAGVGREMRIPTLQLRAGVATGEVAVNLDAVGQGLVAGDAVNTAARVQAAATPGAVWVDDVTRMSSRAAIAYEDRGEHTLKGKAQPMRLFEARRVVARRSGAERTTGLEPPFVGRDTELRLIKELFHASVDKRAVRLVAVSGPAGAGKSRLVWEFKKYLDGIVADVNWHQSRCLSYGEGVAYWALAEMVRGRLAITESDPPDVALLRLREGLVRYVDSPSDRDWLEPRLAALLGLSDVALEGAAPETLFPAWRLFVERVAAEDPAVLVVEDLHWADQGMLDFLDHLLDWSRGYPIFLVTLARPELEERRPEWNRQRRNATPVYLEPLDDESMHALVDGVAPQLPASVQAAVLKRADGIPMYAVETLRMLVDQGVLVAGDDHFVLASPDAGREALTIEIPASLQALVSARLDSLDAEERRTVQDAAVIGMSFSEEDVNAVAAVRGHPIRETRRLLQTLVRRDVLAADAAGPASDQGQYRFLQAVMRTVAYDSMARRDRKARHLAAAAYFAALPEADEIAAVIASHYLDAAAAVPDASDADSLRATAREHLLRAAERSASLGAVSESIAHYEALIRLLHPGDELAAIAERDAELALRAARYDLAKERIELARSSVSQLDARTAARLAMLEGNVLIDLERADEALAVMQPAYAALQDSAPDLVTARLLGAIATGYSRKGAHEEAMLWGERAALLAQELGAWDVFAEGMNARGIGLISKGRWVEAIGMLRMALELCLASDLLTPALRLYINLAALTLTRNTQQALAYAEAGLVLARRLGHRLREQFLMYHVLMARVIAGQWDEVEAAAKDQPSADEVTRIMRFYQSWPVLLVRAARGTAGPGDAPEDDGQEVTDPQSRIGLACQMAELAFMEGRNEAAFMLAQRAVEAAVDHAGIEDEFHIAWPLAVESAVRLGRLSEASELLTLVSERPPGHIAVLLQGQLARLRALVAAASGGGDGVAADFTAGARILRAFGAPFWTARTLLEHGEWLMRCQEGTGARVLLEEALEIFTRLGATPYVERARAALTDARTPSAAAATAL